MVKYACQYLKQIVLLPFEIHPLLQTTGTNQIHNVFLVCENVPIFYTQEQGLKIQ